MWVRLIEISCCRAPAHRGTCENAVHSLAAFLRGCRVWRGVQVSASGRREGAGFAAADPSKQASVSSQGTGGGRMGKGALTSRELYQSAGGFLGRRCSALLSGCGW